MVRSKIFLCAHGTAQDRESNNITVFSIIEQFNVTTFPLAYPFITVFGCFEKDPKDKRKYQVQLKVLNNENEILAVPSELNFLEFPRARLIFQIGGIIIPEPGLLKFILYVNNKVLCDYIVDVVPKAQADVKVRSETSEGKTGALPEPFKVLSGEDT